jgi:hypothetical protein
MDKMRYTDKILVPKPEEWRLLEMARCRSIILK